MINKEQKIPCPVCNTEIHFDTHQLLKGYKFSCQNCSASIGVSSESVSVVKESMEKYESLKQRASVKK